jgi:hypothetical protein
MVRKAAPNKADTKAAKFVDDTAVYRVLGPETAAQHGVTADSIKAQIVGLAAEPLVGNADSRYSKFVTFPDGSCVAQVKGSRRWEVWG